MNGFKVLLVSTYELGHQPLGLASPAAHLLAGGAHVDCMDLAVESFDDHRVGAASLVGLSVPMHTATKLGIQAARRIRRVNPRAHICFYGLYASLNEDFLLKTAADSVIGGEFETPLVGLARYLAGELQELPTGITAAGRRSDPFLGRQIFRLPARHLLPPLERYVRMDDGTRKCLVGAVEASRGCAHHCRHCPITPVYEGRVRIVQERIILEDIANLVEQGAEHITFCDPDFLNGVDHSFRIVRQMKERFPDLTFDITAKVQHLVEYRERLPELRRLGCLFVQSALESLNDRILGILKKEHTRADITAALDLMRGAGLTLRPSLVSFTPWTSADDYRDLIEFVEREDLVEAVDAVQFAIRLLIPPGSRLLKMPELTPYLGPLDEENLRHPWQHPDPRMERLEAAVLAVVEESARVSLDAHRTFDRIKKTVHDAIGGRRSTAPAPARKVVSRKIPRLTESWFCCAEPNARQLQQVEAGYVSTASASGDEGHSMVQIQQMD